MNAVDQLRAGRPVLIEDCDSGGSTEVAQAAQFVDADAVNFMVTHARGLIRIGLEPQRCDDLGLRPMTASSAGRGFTISIEARDGVTTGISAADRARTIAVASDPTSTSHDLVRPGHIVPVRTAAGGLLEREASAEAALDLVRLAGLAPAAVLCHVLDDDGDVLGPAARLAFDAEHRLAAVSIPELVAYRRRIERPLRKIMDVPLRTRVGAFRMIVFHDPVSGGHAAAVLYGNVARRSNPMVRVHLDCGGLSLLDGPCCPRFEPELRDIVEHGCGALLYLAREGAAPALAGDEAVARIADAVGVRAQPLTRG
jgi:3,4-dihydroxy 2-butanone 4-phosphate synthase/GTP cyclohydrolase II